MMPPEVKEKGENIFLHLSCLVTVKELMCLKVHLSLKEKKLQKMYFVQIIDNGM